MNPPKSSQFDSIPLPPRRGTETGASAPLAASMSPAPVAAGTGEVAQNPKPTPEPKRPARRWTRSGESKRRKLGGWLKKHPVILTALIVLSVVGLCVGGYGLSVLADYHEQAKSYNLADMARVEVGAEAMDRRGNAIGRITLQDRRVVSLEQVPKHLIDALVATEDARFYEHNGYDLVGIARAAVANLKAGGIKQGGSTITQQLARHAFSLGGRNFDRKLREFFLAQRIESAYSKEEILEHYLNRIYFGGGYWGVGAAARGYFGKDVSELNLTEAATLAAIIKSPNNLSPFIDPEGAVTVRNRTLARMEKIGFLEASEVESLSDAPLGALESEDREGRPNYLLTKIRSEALEILGRNRALDGLVIRTTVDFDVQGQLKDALQRGIARVEARGDFQQETAAEFQQRKSEDASAQPRYLQGAGVVIENATGRIVAAVGGRNFRESQFNRVWDGHRPPGSAFFPLVYAAAFESGKLTPESEILDAATDNRKVMVGGTEGVLGEWSAEDPNVSYLGKLTAGYGLVSSKNGMTLKVGNQVGLDSVAALAKNAGIESELRDFPSTYLGASSVNLLDLTHAYTIFPNLGWKSKEARLISSIEDKDGQVLYRESPSELSKHWVTSELSAARVSQLLSATFENGTAKQFRNITGRLNGEVAGKSGTAYGFTDNWFVGYNPRYTWGVWVGFDESETIYPEAFGKDTALPIWLSLATALDTQGEFRMPPNMVRSPVCLVSGHVASERCRHGEQGLVVELPVIANNVASVGATDACLVHEKTAIAEKIPQIVSRTNDSLYGNVPVIPTKQPALVGNDPYGTIVELPSEDSAVAR